MIDERFSAKAFCDAGFGSEKARALSRQLQDAIAQGLSESLANEMNSVITQLNALGHHLEPYGPQTADAKHFREQDPDKAQAFKFLVALDLVVSVGYPQTTD